MGGWWLETTVASHVPRVKWQILGWQSDPLQTASKCGTCIAVLCSAAVRSKCRFGRPSALRLDRSKLTVFILTLGVPLLLASQDAVADHIPLKPRRLRNS